MEQYLTENITNNRGGGTNWSNFSENRGAAFGFDEGASIKFGWKEAVGESEVNTHKQH